MERKQIEERCIDLVEGTLSPEEEQELREAIERDEELRVSFRAYERTVSVEEQLREIADDPGDDFVSAVMDRVRHEGDPVGQQDSGRRWSMWYQKYRRQVVGLVGAGGVVSLGLLMLPEVQHSAPEGSQATVPTAPMAIGGSPSPNRESIATSSGDPAVRDQGEGSALNSSNAAGGSEQTKALAERFDKTFSTEGFLALASKKLVDPRMMDARMNSLGQYEWKTGTIRKRLIEKIDQSAGEGSLGLNANGALLGSESWELRMREQSQVAATPSSFLSTTAAPHSTFSLDVDTGSYTNARKAIRQGYRPLPQTVRAEEFINYFRYSYPTPSEHPLGTHYELAPSPITKGAKILSVAVSTKALTERDKPWNLVFLIDTSGSMSDSNKLPLVKNALKVLAAKMRSTDRLSIVTYADGARVALEPSGLSEKDHIDAVIDGLSAGGGTNGGAGLSLAYDKAQSAFIPEGVNRVVLATDGDFNVGVTNHADLISQIEQQRAKHISLTTLGVGEANYKEHLMEQLADKGDGNYFYLDGFREAQKIFGEDLFLTIETVAKDVKVQVEFNPARVASYRLIGYQNRALAPEQFRDDAVDAGEVGAGHRVTALYEIVLVGDEAQSPAFVEHRYGPTPAPTVAVTPSGPLSQELGFVRIRFKKPESNTSEQLSFPLSADRLQSSLSSASSDLRFATAVGAFAEKLASGVGMPFGDIISLAESARGDDVDGKRTEFIGLVREVAAMP